jgi:7-cyano-7-deazaguanine synthase
MSEHDDCAVVICSGGMDSTTLAHLAAERHDGVHLVGFNYGQRHEKELVFAASTARHLGARFSLIRLPIGEMLHGSALTDDSVPVPEGHYADASMRATVVPNRNAIMLSVAWGIATADQADALYTGVHAGDHPIYPDCRPSFIWAMGAALRIATDGYAPSALELRAPFLHASKADIVRAGELLGVDWTNTWSCYQGGAKHCGRCGTCVERHEAFEIVGVVDPTEYE